MALEVIIFSADSFKVPVVSGKLSIFAPDILDNRQFCASMYSLTAFAKFYLTSSHIISSKMIFKFEICYKRSK